MIEAIINNEICVWDRLKQVTKPILLYGTGDGADKIIDICIEKGINIYGIFVSDDFARGQMFRGYKVKKLSDFEKEIDDFIVAVAFASNRNEVIENIKKISEKYELLVPNVPVFGLELADREFFIKNSLSIKKVFNKLSDETSKIIFYNVLRFYFTGKIEYFWKIHSIEDDGLINIINPSEDEIYVDAGAYNGDTIQEFISVCKGVYKHIYAFEPNPKTFRKLCEFTKFFENITLFNMGTYDEKTELPINVKKGRGTSANIGNINVPFDKIDSYINKATYLKIDVEGAERETLKGAERLIKSENPKICISLYHHFSDIFEIPLIIDEMNKKYKFYIRKVPCFPCWDLNLYAV